MLRLESLDTNVILELILNRDPKKAERAFNLITTPRSYFFIPDQAIMEICYTLCKKYGYSKQEFVDSLKIISNFSRLDYDAETFNRVSKYYLAHPKLSIADCYMTVKMSDLNRTPFWTFDEKLAKQLPAASLVPELA